MAAKKKPGPDTPSADYDAMIPLWSKVQTMLDGLEAMRLAGKRFLPQFPKERKAHYDYRLANAKFTNIFRDIVENIASKPFSKICKLNDQGAGPDLLALNEDVDASGNSLHVFAGEVMFFGVAKGLDWIFVDYTKIPTGGSLADEKAMGARPYWVRIPAENVIEARTAMVDGKEQFIRVRILEEAVEAEGEWGEKVSERVRMFRRDKLPKERTIDPDAYGPPIWELYEKRVNATTSEVTWEIVESGQLRIPAIPLVPFLTGRRKGRSWRINAPMKDAADVQEKHYQQETNLENVKDRMCFPVLVGMGVPNTGADGRKVEIDYGPATVLFAPALGAEGRHGDWKIIEPAAQSMTFLASDLEATTKQLRELGRQPLTAQSGNLTVVTTAVAAQKANSAAQAWALNLKDALEQAWRFTCMWLGDESSKPDVSIHTDFGVELGDGNSMERVLKMRQARDIDRETLWNEAIRRGDLASDFDKEAVKRRLAEEAPEPDEQDDLEASTTPRLRAA